MINNDPILFTIPGTCSTGPHILLEELQIPYQVCIVSNDILLSTNFAKINPLKQVGALSHNGFIMYENLAILSYLANKYSPNASFISQNNPDRFGHIMQWLSFITTTVHSHFARIYHPKLYVNSTNTPDMLDHAQELLAKNYAFLDQHLNTNKYLTGNDYAICDFEAYAVLRWAFDDNIFKKNEYLNVNKFLSNMRDLRSVQNVQNIENNQLAQLINSKFNGYFIIN